MPIIFDTFDLQNSGIMVKNIFTVLIIVLASFQLSGQNYKSSWLLDNNPSVPTEGRRSIDFSGESYLFGRGQSFWATRLAFYYGFGKERKHMAGIQIPFLISDYSGMSTKMGFGDLYFGYFFFPYRDNSGNKSLQAVGLGLTTFAPTGNKDNGLGREEWVFTFHTYFNVRLSERWALYPMARYLFSFDSAYSRTIAIPPGNVPEPPPESTDLVNSLQTEVQVVYEMPKVGAWLMLSPSFSYDFKRSKYSFATQTRIGKMFTKKFAMSLSWSIVIAGDYSFKNAFQLFFISYLK